MAVTLSEKWILASFCVFLEGLLPSGLRVSWDGSSIDTASINAWCEVTIPVSRRPKQRRGSNDERKTTLQVNLFQKPIGNTLQHLRLERKIVPVLTHAEIDIHDYSAVGEPKIGQMRLYEVTAKDKSREFNSRGETNNRAQDLSQLARTNLKLIQLTCNASLQAV